MCLAEGQVDTSMPSTLMVFRPFFSDSYVNNYGKEKKLAYEKFTTHPLQESAAVIANTFVADSGSPFSGLVSLS